VTPEDTTTPPVRTPIFDDLIAQAGIDWPEDVRPAPAREPEAATPGA